MTRGTAVAECRFCQQWQPAADDTFCSFCGRLQLLLEVGPESLVLISTIAPAKELMVSNDSTRAMSVTIAPRNGVPPPGLTFEPDSTFVVPAAGKVSVHVSVDAQKLPAGFQRVVEYACTVDGDVRKQRGFKLDVRSGPAPQLLTRTLDFAEVEEGKAVGRTLELTNAGSVVLRIKDVLAIGSPHLSIDGDFAGHLLKHGEKLSIPVTWRSSPNDEEADADESAAGVRIDFGNYPEVLFVPASAHVFRYHLNVKPGSIRFNQALAKRDYTATIRLENAGTSDVEILSVESDQPWISVVSRANTFTLLAAGKRAMTPTTFTGSYELRIVCRPAGLAEGRYHGRVTIRPHARPPVIVPVEAAIVAAKEYAEYIGIDFGTTNSVVAVKNPRRNDAIELVKDDLSGKVLIPSVLVFDDPETYKIGEAARKEAGAAPDRTVRSIKRVMGYERDRNFFDRSYSAGELASLIIRKLVQLAEQKLHDDSGNGAHYTVRKAIITVPANFHDLQIRDVLEACKTAGLDTEEEKAEKAVAHGTTEIGETVSAGIILDEPSAAVLYYIDFLRRTRSAAEITKAIARKSGLRLLVFDYGGGTLDVSVAGVSTVNGGGTGLRILANMGDNAIGGDHIDVLIMNELLRRCARQLEDFTVDPSLIASNFPDLERRRDLEGWSAAVWQHVLSIRAAWKDLAEKTKIAIADGRQESIDIHAPFIVRVEDGTVRWAPRDLRIDRLPENAVQDLLQPVLFKCEELVRDALALAKTDASEIDYILHTGRQSLLPHIRRCVRGIFPDLSDDRDLLEEEHLKICVAKGAALYGSMRERLVRKDARIFFLSEGRRLPHSYGVETFVNPFEPEFDEVIARGESYPVDRTKPYPADMIPPSGYLNLKFYQNTGSGKAVVGNPHVSLIGQISIDTAENGKSGVDVKFAVGANRTLHVFANGKPVNIEPARLHEEESWMG